MKLHIKIFIGCILISLVLFADGMSILTHMNKSMGRKPDNKFDLVKQNGLSGDSSIAFDGPVNIIILGLDEEEFRSDVIVLLNFNPINGKMNILSIARDTKVRANGKTCKINALIGMGGERLLAEKVKELTGLQVNYYLTLNFAGFKKIIDVLDGVEIDVPFDMNYDDPVQKLHIHLKKGRQILDGEKAEQFVRYRKGNRNGQGYTDGDLGRINAQQEFIRALINQKLRIKYFSKVDDIYFILKKYMRTNIDIADINYYIKYMQNVKYDGIQTFTLPGEPAYLNDVWYFIYDREKTEEIIESNFFK